MIWDARMREIDDNFTLTHTHTDRVNTSAEDFVFLFSVLLAGT